MNILTCNIRSSGAEDGTNNWVYRKDLCIEVIQSRSPDIICFQEMAANQFADIHSSLREFGGFAFVEMSSDAEAQKAISEFDGKEVDGRTLKVNEAKPREDRGGGGRQGRW